MATDTHLQNFIINKLTKAQYNSLTYKNPNELYVITDYYDNSKAVTMVVTGTTNKTTSELPLGTVLTTKNQILMVNVGNSIIMPNLYHLSPTGDVIVLDNALESDLDWSVTYLQDLDLGTLPKSSETVVGLTRLATQKEATDRARNDIAITPKNLLNYATKDDVGAVASITNCLTEIPQDIKLELKDGTLTLKAGSKVYFGDGSNKTIPADKDFANRNFDWSNQFVVLFKDTLGFEAVEGKFCSSGPTPTFIGSSTISLWFDTNTNQCKFTSDKGQSWRETCLPIAICSSFVGKNWVSIDKVFNGLGYIGSTVYILPNVSGIIPNYLKDNGSLQNTSFTTNQVLTYTITKDFNANGLIFNGKGTIANVPWLGSSDKDFESSERFPRYYNYRQNIMKIKSGTTQSWIDQTSFMYLGYIKCSSDGRIEQFKPQQVFHATDYNEFISELNKKADDSKVVHSTGNEDIAGLKRFTSNNLQVCNSNFDITQNTPDKQYINYQFRGKSGKDVGGMYMRQDTNGVTNNTLYVIGRNDKRASIYAQVFADGTRRTCTDCIPPVSANDSQIVTTKYINEKFKVVSALPAQPDPNVFYIILK